MDRELQDYYENRFSLFGTTGWKDLIQDVEKIKESVDSLRGADTLEQLYFKKGELSILNWILNLEDSSKEVYDQLQEEAKDA
jgi:hypothetical protein